MDFGEVQVALLAFHFGKNTRGVETWARDLQVNVPNPFKINIISGWSIYNPRQWRKSQVVIATDGRLSAQWCRIITWLTRTPLVIFGHSGPGADDKWNLWCSPNVFVAFSNPQAKWANKFKLPWTKVVVIPHAVDTAIFFPDAKIKKEIDVLCVAANSPDKRVDLVRRAAANLKLRVVGSGQLDQVPFSQMPKVYNQARVFCLVPQMWEAFGLVFLEALACNLPVVTVNDPVRREIVGDAGILVDHPDNSRELASAVGTALSKDWGNLPRKQAERFSWSKISYEYKSLFASL